MSSGENAWLHLVTTGEPGAYNTLPCIPQTPMSRCPAQLTHLLELVLDLVAGLAGGHLGLRAAKITLSNVAEKVQRGQRFKVVCKAAMAAAGCNRHRTHGSFTTATPSMTC